ncbi:MAG: 2OG-Fe(II) oxygenase [Bacteroidetes bacterium]|nr:2OG-Fe(II) oxygenase [Bacteroidota bacterium]
MVINSVINAISEKGYAIVPDFFSVEEVDTILSFFNHALQEGHFRQAGIGKEQEKQVQTSIRGDRILWIEEDMTPFDTLFYPRVQEFMTALNRTFYLGMNAHEFHLALYPETTFYKKHRDAFKNTDARKISMVMYLNKDWQPGDGGELALYTEDETHIVKPLAGTLVIFESSLEHEVLTSNKPRYSLTGWLKRQDSLFP